MPTTRVSISYFNSNEDVRRNLDLFYAPLNDAAAKSYILRR